MMCKRCNTSVSDEDRFCKVCGKKLKENGRLKKFIAILIIICGIAACGVYIYFNINGYFDVPDENDITGTDSLLTEEPVTDIPTPAPTQTPEATADFSKDIDEVWDILAKSNAACGQFMMNYSYTPFISKNGYLFDLAANRAVNMSDLAMSGNLDKKYEEEKVFFLYLRPCDFAGFSEVEFDDSSALAVFSAYETKTGVALYNNAYQGIIYRENLNSILTMYGSDGGEAVRTASSNKEYAEIISAVSSYDPNYNEFDVRYMVNDGKYAVAVLSPKDDSAKLLGYVLEKSDTGYSVINGNFERYQRPTVGVNAVIPHMNIALMPKFDIGKTALLPAAAYSGAAEALRNKGEITDGDFPVVFVSGTSEYLYMVFDSGVKFFGVNKNAADWNITRVDSWLSAEILLSKEEREAPPVYIFRQE